MFKVRKRSIRLHSVFIVFSIGIFKGDFIRFVGVAEEVDDSAGSVMEIIDSIYDGRAMQPENARSNNVELQVDENKLAMSEFKALWGKINSKSVYVVDFDTDELVRKAITSLDTKLRVSKIYVNVKFGELDRIDSKYL